MVGEVAIGFTPLGVVVDVIDLAKAVHSGDGTAIAVAAIGFIPGGDIAKAAYKAHKVAKAVRKVAGKADKVADVVKLAKRTDVPCACFAAGTIVHAEEGEVPIESVEPGALVWSSAPKEGSIRSARPRATAARRAAACQKDRKSIPEPCSTGNTLLTARVIMMDSSSPRPISETAWSIFFTL